MSGHNQFALLRQRRFAPYFIVQALGAFNDNVYRQAIIGLLFWLGLDADQRGLYATLAPAIFIAPYFLFSAIAGQVADKLEKQRLIVITTTMEIAIMSLAAVGFFSHNLPLLLVALFATGVQSTLFGPVKYSVLPSILKPEELTGGNGLVEMGTAISVLGGMITGGLIFHLAGSYGPEVAAVTIIVLAVLGNLVARLIPRIDAGEPGLKVNWNPLPESLKAMRMARQQLAVRNAILGVSWFWFFGTIITSLLPVWAERSLGGTADSSLLYIFALALFSIGTGTGSLLCEKLSARTVEIGLVPLGAFGMSAFLLDLYLARPGAAPVAGLDVAAFLAQPGSTRIIIDLLGIGLSTGLFVVPLFALIQSRTPSNQVARVFAALNIQNSAFIVAAAGTGLLAGQVLGWDGPQLLLALAIANVLVAVWIFSIVPEFAMRVASWLMVRTLYRLRVRGIEQHVPDEGAAVLVCNHVSYMDALILAAVIPRPARFVMYWKIYQLPFMHWIFRTARTIPIASPKENPALLEAAFDAIDQALANGELVVIFPEGALTRDGDIATFKGGVERILARRPVPVVPLALRGMWASMWSRRDSRLGRMRVPRRLRAHIEVHAGPPMAAGSTAAELEQAVRGLRGDQA